MQTPTIQKKRTCRSLFNEFKGRYTIDEVENHAQLKLLYDYLENRCSLVNGDYYPEPSPYMADMLKKFLDYEEKKPTGSEPMS